MNEGAALGGLHAADVAGQDGSPLSLEAKEEFVCVSPLFRIPRVSGHPFLFLVVKVVTFKGIFKIVTRDSLIQITIGGGYFTHQLRGLLLGFPLA